MDSFRVQLQPKYRALVERLLSGAAQSWKECSTGGWVVTTDAGPEVKQLVRDTGLCGRGLAILGLDGFNPTEPRVVVEFDHVEDAVNFKTWLCNVGDQGLWDYLDGQGEPWFGLDFHDPGGCVVRATRGES